MKATHSKQSINKKKFKLHKKKRAQVANMKKVHVLEHGKTTVLRKHKPSKKKLHKDSKRRRIYADAEKAKLLKSGLITQEDIDRMEAEKAELGSDGESAVAEEAMELEK